MIQKKKIHISKVASVGRARHHISVHESFSDTDNAIGVNACYSVNISLIGIIILDKIIRWLTDGPVYQLPSIPPYLPLINSSSRIRLERGRLLVFCGQFLIKHGYWIMSEGGLFE